MVPRSPVGLVQVHEKFAAAAKRHRFPRLHPDATRTWTLSKTERLLKLHSYATDQHILSKWEDDPGAHEAERILSSFGKEDLLHEHHLLAKLCDHLLDANIPVPYTIGSISGIVLLNHPPDFSESEKRFLKALSSRRPIHHVCVQGSFRLGFHGAYIDDEIKPIEGQRHYRPGSCTHSSTVGTKPEDYATDGVHIISFDRATQVMDAAISALQHYRSSGGGSVLLIDANKDRHSEWNRRLSQIGITCDTQADVVGSASAVQAILRFLSISYGQDAGPLPSCLTSFNRKLFLFWRIVRRP